MPKYHLEMDMGLVATGRRKSLLIPVELDERLRLVAFDRRVSEARVIREALERYLRPTKPKRGKSREAADAGDVSRSAGAGMVVGG